MFSPKENFNYLNCNLGNSYFIIPKNNQFYHDIWNYSMGAYYIKLIKIKGLAFKIFQKVFCWLKCQFQKNVKHLHTNFKKEFANQALKKYTIKTYIK